MNTTALFDEYSRVCAERDALAQQRDATKRLCAQHKGKIHELRDLLADCAQQRDAAVRERDVWEREAVDGREVLAHHKRELDAALHQIKIAKVCNDSQAELIERLTLEKMQRFDELNTLRARLAACEGGLNYIWRVTVGAVESDELAATCKTIGEYRAVLLKAIDALSLDDDFGPNADHARTVNRTPPQDAATTRGEG